jgi:hypothetical protein
MANHSLTGEREGKEREKEKGKESFFARRFISF